MRKWVRRIALAFMLLGAIYTASTGPVTRAAAPVSPFEAAQGAYEREDYEAAYAIFREQAELGNAISQYRTGRMLARGRGVEANEAEARTWFELATDQGHNGAREWLAFLLATGRGGEQDMERARRLYETAAANGSDTAREALAKLAVQSPAMVVGISEYNRGNYLEAYPKLLEAAEQEHPLAQVALGVMFDEGRGVEQNDRQAAYWFLRAAYNGNANAQNNIGLAYRTGRGVGRDTEKALEWFQRAHDGGDPKAAGNIAGMYLTGDGVAQDFVKAAEWLRRGAEAGLAPAQYNLARMLECGDGVAQDLSAAAALYEAAALQGVEGAREAFERTSQGKADRSGCLTAENAGKAA